MGSPFAKWELASWIRSKPSREGSLLDGLCWSPDLMPVSNHPAVREVEGAHERLLAFAALEHWTSTRMLEIELVGPASTYLAYGDHGMRLTEELRHDLLKVHCDEAGHALFVHRLAEDVVRDYGLSLDVVSRVHCMAVFHEQAAGCAGSFTKSWLGVFYACIAESLFPSQLRDVPKDLRVAKVVREVQHDHFLDELLHMKLFETVLGVSWAHLDENGRGRMAPILGSLAKAILDPDYAMYSKMLTYLGFSDATTKQIIADSYPEEETRAATLAAAKPLVNALEKSGALEHRGMRQALIDVHLISR